MANSRTIDTDYPINWRKQESYCLTLPAIHEKEEVIDINHHTHLLCRFPITIGGLHVVYHARFLSMKNFQHHTSINFN